MSWNVTISGHEPESSTPDQEKVDAVANAALSEARKQGLTPTYVSRSPGGAMDISEAEPEDD